MKIEGIFETKNNITLFITIFSNYMFFLFPIPKGKTYMEIHKEGGGIGFTVNNFIQK